MPKKDLPVYYAPGNVAVLRALPLHLCGGETAKARRRRHRAHPSSPLGRFSFSAETISCEVRDLWRPDRSILRGRRQCSDPQERNRGETADHSWYVSYTLVCIATNNVEAPNLFGKYLDRATAPPYVVNPVQIAAISGGARAPLLAYEGRIGTKE